MSIASSVSAMRASSSSDRKSTRLNSSHANISYAVFCLKKKKEPLICHPSLTSFQVHLVFGTHNLSCRHTIPPSGNTCLSSPPAFRHLLSRFPHQFHTTS